MTSSMKLSRREREILDVLFALGGSASAEQIRAALSDPPSYSATRAMLAKLEKKGGVEHRAEGLRYVYSPCLPRSAAQTSALGRLLQVFFGGSRSALVSALLNQEAWTEEELDALKAQIARMKRSTSREL